MRRQEAGLFRAGDLSELVMEGRKVSASRWAWTLVAGVLMVTWFAGAHASAKKRAATVPATAPAAGGNPVEPLSNGLRCSMTRDEIVQQFGEPSEPTWDSRSFGYKDAFFVQVGGARQEIWHLTLKRNVRLACGLGVGSTRAEVEKVFGDTAKEVKRGQYGLRFAYDDKGRVSEIKIDPAEGSFADYRKDAPEARKDGPLVAADLAGVWFCVAPSTTVGKIEIKADGTWSSGQSAGRYAIEKNDVLFDGNLKAWNGGRATLKGEILEFLWKDAAGAAYYFAFAKEGKK